VDELLASDFVNHMALPTQLTHRELYKQVIVETRTAFPDWTIEIEDLIAEGNKVVGRWRAHGTHTGKAWGMTPAGKYIRTKLDFVHF
jgi:predicted ester cyclase